MRDVVAQFSQLPCQRWVAPERQPVELPAVLSSATAKVVGR